MDRLGLPQHLPQGAGRFLGHQNCPTGQVSSGVENDPHPKAADGAAVPDETGEAGEQPGIIVLKTSVP